MEAAPASTPTPPGMSFLHVKLMLSLHTMTSLSLQTEKGLDENAEPTKVDLAVETSDDSEEATTTSADFDSVQEDPEEEQGRLGDRRDTNFREG